MINLRIIPTPGEPEFSGSPSCLRPFMTEENEDTVQPASISLLIGVDYVPAESEK